MSKLMLIPLAWLEQHARTANGEPRIMLPGELKCAAHYFTVGDGHTVPEAVSDEAEMTIRSFLADAPSRAAFPAEFAGYATDDEQFRCADNGCSCGWTYQYAVGEPMAVVA
ncbi:hypothetical protein OG911_11760 [Streptomyces sp. NBC_00208]|uniref:hypothetical protein n=1 Tax=Streptomyces sp. NBC_00208 TaxID=2975681 RepID=UPI002E2AC4A5|nr:hypothetical protein [Streptomyces sp. NBC_00208]